jgi:hypothetical protein
MPTYSIDPLYPHWIRCEQCGKDVASLFPAEAIDDLVNLTAAQVLEVCPEAAADIDGHEHGCPGMVGANGMAEANGESGG